MSALQIQSCLVALVACSASAWAQEAEQPPIDPYADAEPAADASASVAPASAADDQDPPIDPATESAADDALAAGDEPVMERNALPAYPFMPPPEAPVPKRRAGLMGGLALGVGSLGAGNDSNGTVNYTLSFGGYLSNSLALLVDLWGGRVSDEDFRINNSKQGVSALYWISQNMWAKASLGSASYTTYVDDVMLSDFSGVAIGGGLGWEFYQRGNFHVDARFSLTVEGYKNARDNVSATALQIGLHYF